MEMWKGFEKFWSLPGFERSGEVLSGAENAELLEFVVRMVEHDVFCVKSPLVLKKRLQVLAEGGRKALYPKPFGES